MRRIVDFAVDHARLTIAILIFLLAGGRQRLCEHPEGSRAGHHDSDHLRPAVAARHFAGGCRAAARQAGGDLPEERHQRQGDARRGVRGRRLCPARVRGGLQFRRRAAGRARQGRRRQGQAAGRRRRAARRRRSISASSRSSSSLSAATCRSGPSNRLAHEAQDAIELVPGVLSADAARACGTRWSRSSPSRCCLNSYGVSLDQFAARRRAGQQPGGGRRAGRRAGPFRDQGAGADRNAGGRPQHSGRRVQRRRRSPSATWRRSCRPSRTPPPSPASTGSRPSRSRSRNGPAPTSSRRSTA